MGATPDSSSTPNAPIFARLGAPAAGAANMVVILCFAWLWWLNSHDPDAYFHAVQEDGFLEWATFWGFIVAAWLWGVASLRQRRDDRRVPWFLAGVLLFCAFVAMEEISWGQRLLGYQPPAYFLRENFQQELNFHNVVNTSLRSIVFQTVVLGYGVVLPLVARIPWAQKLIDRVAIVAPPLALVPAFLAIAIVYQVYPFSHVGEVSEAMLGFAFLYAAWACAKRGAPTLPPARALVTIGALTAVVAALALGSAFASDRLAGDDPARVAEAERELAAMARDCEAIYQRRAGGLKRKRGLHKRVYTYVRKYGKEGADALKDGAFAALRTQGLPTERAEFFLDPWNSPYWVSKKTTDDKGYALLKVYSFGPNRRRDSTDWETRGDDIGVVFAERGERPETLEVDVR